MWTNRSPRNQVTLKLGFGIWFEDEDKVEDEITPPPSIFSRMHYTELVQVDEHEDVATARLTVHLDGPDGQRLTHTGAMLLASCQERVKANDRLTWVEEAELCVEKSGSLFSSTGASQLNTWDNRILHVRTRDGQELRTSTLVFYNVADDAAVKWALTKSGTLYCFS